MALGVFTALSVFSFQDPVTQFWIQVFGAVNPLQQMLAITKLEVMDGFVEEKCSAICSCMWAEMCKSCPSIFSRPFVTHNLVRIMNYKLSDFVLIYLWGHCEVITSWTAAQHEDRIMGSSGTETGRDGTPGGRNEWSVCWGVRVPGSLLLDVMCAIVHTGMLWFSLEHYCVVFSRMPETLVLYCTRPFVFRAFNEAVCIHAGLGVNHAAPSKKSFQPLERGISFSTLIQGWKTIQLLRTDQNQI